MRGWLLFLAVAAACGDDSGSEADGGSVVTNVVITHPDRPPIAPATECTVETADAVSTPAGHTGAVCDPVEYATIPPAWGDHYPAWADFLEYDAPVPWGFLVHSMEHGALVLAYSCGDACPEVLAAFRAIKAERRDARCAGELNRVIIVPQPDLDVPIAAAGWGTIYRATCLDEESLRAFADRAYAAGPENFCSAGRDLSATGWCDAADAGAGDAGVPADAGANDAGTM